MAVAGTTSGKYLRPAEEIPVLGAWDVVVCGGGPAGCAAAYASARHGAKTLLVECGGSPGGAPVTQGVWPILSTNGVDFQGVWHIWARELRRLGGIAGLVRDTRHGGNWYRGTVDPEKVKFAWESLLDAVGAEVLYLAVVTGAIVEEGAVRGVIVETKGGPYVLRAERIVDATGDGDFCARAGVAWEQGLNGAPWTQAVSLNGWYGGTDDAVPEWKAAPGLCRVPTGLQRVLCVNPLDPFDLTRVMREGRREILRRFEARKVEKHEAGLYLGGIADHPGVRASRRIRGLAAATADDAWNFRHYADGIAKCSWEIDIHLPDREKGKGVEFASSEYAERLKRAAAGEWFDIRYGCLVADGVDGLLVAGRCLSCDAVAQSCLRIQQTCMATGEAAGLAAAKSLSDGVAPAALDIGGLVRELETVRGVEPAFETLK